LSVSGDRRRLRQLLRGLHPSQTLVVADMTNTLLEQSLDGAGYPEAARRLHREYLVQGGVLVVVTGDSLAVVRQQFLTPLDFQSGELFIISGAGHRIDKVGRTNGQVRLRCLHRGEQISAKAREDLLRRVVAELEGETGRADSAWLAANAPRLLRGDGVRIDVGGFYPALKETCYIEVVPNKVTCFFSDRPRAKGLAARILDRLAANQSLRRAARSQRAQVVRGPNFVDIIAGDKGTALGSFARLPKIRRLGLADRTLILMGDSVNDHSMFGYAGLRCRSKIMIYLGGDDLPKVGESARRGFVHLREANVAGSQFVFGLLSQD
jgi:hydroxymethylpyrimidine pyrophosphatase-like HAD family hydrolase